MQKRNSLSVFLAVMAVISAIGGVLSFVIFLGDSLVLSITYLVAGILSCGVLTAIADTLNTTESIQHDVGKLRQANMELSEKLDHLLSKQNTEAEEVHPDDPNAPRCIRCRTVLPKGYAGNICPRCRDISIRASFTS